MEVMSPTTPSSGTWEFFYSGNLKTNGLLVTRMFRVTSNCQAQAVATSAYKAMELFEDPRLMEGPKRIKTRVPTREREKYTPRS